MHSRVEFLASGLGPEPRNTPLERPGERPRPGRLHRVHPGSAGQDAEPSRLGQSLGHGTCECTACSVKVTSLYSQIDEADWESSKTKVKERLRPIFTKAVERAVFINLDMEQYAHKDFILEVFLELINEPEYKDYRHWGIVIQAYLRDSINDSRRLSEAAARERFPSPSVW